MKEKIKKIICTSFALSAFLGLSAQNTIYGEVKNKSTKEPLAGASVTLSANPPLNEQTDANGHFHFRYIGSGTLKITISHLGYKKFEREINPAKDKHLVIYLEEESISLNEVVIRAKTEKESTLSTDAAGKIFLFENNSVNLVKTLSKIPGVSSMDIGSGFSKPVIRGFSFNRVAVVDKGVTQQDQQWGADHGLTLNQYEIEDVLVHKGPMSLQFGSDAIGGVIEIMQPRIPSENIYLGDITLIGKSNNDLSGISLTNALKYNKWYLKTVYTYLNYADYRVPADSFYLHYMRRSFPIENKRLKNTAGREHNLSAYINYTSNKIFSGLSISNIYQKNGFFPGAHGLPDPVRLEPDGSHRNIEMPYNTVNHFKMIENLNIGLSEKIKWITDIGYQHNMRKEWSAFHTHYNNVPVPGLNPDLELQFSLHTLSLNTKAEINTSDKLIHNAGLQSTRQDNSIAGYSYFLPEYKQYTIGGYYLAKLNLNPRLKIESGLRYDFAKIKIKGFYDNLLAEYLRGLGYNETDIQYYAQRAPDASLLFNNFSISAGAIYIIGHASDLKVNIGKSFRFPTAAELASNGVHHGAFRHEQSDINLQQEESYQLDMVYSLHKNRLNINISPYITYFSNYIFLAPEGNPSILPHSGQIYKYKEAEAFFAGGEYSIAISPFHSFEFTTGGQFVFNRNMTQKTPLPFTPPFTMHNELVYFSKYKALSSFRISFEHRWIAAQNRVANNEDKTPGTNLFNASINTNLQIDKFRFTVGLQAQNIFNTKYLNHLSFYRRLELPDPGRNIQLLIKIPFYTNLK